MIVTMLHPFTPKAAGVKESSVQWYHSQPHRKAMEMLATQPGYDCRMQYFTSRFSSYASEEKGVKTEFFPVSWKLNGDHRKWKKQVSKSCYTRYNKNCPDVSVINMSGHSSPFSYELSKLIRQKGKPYIAMLGGQHYTDTPWVQEYYREAHHIFVHTNLQRNVMLGMEMFKDLDIRVFPLGVDCQYFSPAEQETTRQQISLLYVGRIIEWKRVHLAIEVVKNLKASETIPVYLKIVGPVVSEPYYMSLQNLVKEYGLEDRVRFMGYQDHDKIRDTLRQSDLLLLPSENETFGMVIVESMACGVPVAGVQGGHGPDEVIVNGVNGVLTSADQYVQAVTRFMQRDHDQVLMTRQAARQTAVTLYNIEETYKILQTSVNDCLR